MTLEIITTSEDSITGILTGRLDTAASQKFTNDMKPLVQNADKHIILDCSALEFISSSGLRLFLTIRKATMAKGSDVTIIGASEDIKQVFKITGFSPLFIFKD